MIDLILPCLNEEKALDWVLSRIPKGVNAIVVDNGSVDNSKEIAMSFGAKVIECEMKGYGAACHKGLEISTSSIVAFCDCDATIDPSKILSYAENILNETKDIAICKRIPESFGAMSISMRIANRELARRIRRRTSYPIYDLGPLRIANREKYVELNIKDRRSGYPLETILKANQNNLRLEIFEVPYLKRAGKSKVTGTIAGTLNAIKDMNRAFKEMDDLI